LATTEKKKKHLAGPQKKREERKYSSERLSTFFLDIFLYGKLLLKHLSDMPRLTLGHKELLLEYVK